MSVLLMFKRVIVQDVADLWKNVRHVVNPVGKWAVNQVMNRQRFPLSVDNKVLSRQPFLFLLDLLVELVEADRWDVRRGADACNLCSKVVALIAGERRVTDDLQTQPLSLSLSLSAVCPISIEHCWS